jgi:cell division protein FtsI (penicillin-binding protein 3)
MRTDDRVAVGRRCALVASLLGLFLMVVGFKAVYLQVYCGPWLTSKAADEIEKEVNVLGRRGTIYDTTQRKLAVAVNADSIAVFRSRLENPKAAAAALAPILEVSSADLHKKLTAGRSFMWLKRQAGPKQVEAVRKLDLKGVEFVSEYGRYYPYRSLAGQALGFCNIDGHGLEGLEFFYDSDLKGAEQTIVVRQDALGRGFDGQQPQGAEADGSNIVLTIDMNIQFAVEKALEAAVTGFKAKSGIALVLAPKTGAILAMGHYPLFNPNAREKYEPAAWRNRAITDVYEPGSTLKIFSVAAAVESGAFTPGSSFFCENGRYRIGPNTVHDTHPYGWLTVEQIIKYSSNIGAVKIGQSVGAEALYNTLRGFGFGERLGVDCMGEATGSLAHYKRWKPIDAGTIAFGQGISVSALQLAAAVGALANGGVLMKPYLVEAVTDHNGRLLRAVGPQPIRRVVSPASAQRMLAMMGAVVMGGGTGVNAALEGYSAGGKTGTAQKIAPTGGYAAGKYVSSFVGFAPAENPEVVILVTIDEPTTKHYGGTVAAPAFKQIAHETLVYMGVPPQQLKDKIMLVRSDEVTD